MTGGRFSAREIETLRSLARVMLPEGHGLPGAEDVKVAERFVTVAQTWDDRVLARVRMLLAAWEWSPLATRRRGFSRLSPEDQSEWTEKSYRSKSMLRRMHTSILKQLVFLVWASTPEAEAALGYDGSCISNGDAAPPAPSAEPSDLHRSGPAVRQGAVPLRLVTRRSFEERPTASLSALSWPDVDGGVVTCDVAVVGSGAGGAVVAATLAERGLRVVVLEEGRQVRAEEDFSGPVFERFQAMCRDNATTQVWSLPPIPLPLGKVVGGTTVVNAGTCFRTPERVIERWRSEHAVDLDGDLDRHYSEIEDYLNVRPVPWERLGPNGTIVHRGATELGLSGGPLLRNITGCHGCGQCTFGCPTDSKQAMHVSYLPRAQGAGADVIARARVERILTDRDHVVVKASLLDAGDRERATLEVKADRVVVCAGAIHTPVLLRRSGLVDASGQTGRNLRLHPATGVGAYFDHDVFNWRGTLQSYYIDSLFESHEVMFEATTTVPGVGAGSIPGIGARAMEELAAFKRLATLGFMVSDTSAGRVRRGPGGEAVATYRLNHLDVHRIGIALATAAEILLAAGATRVYVGLPGIESVSARADLEQLRAVPLKAAQLRLSAFHPMGTARMSADPTHGVVDEWGRHHGAERVWVADASVFPSCIGVNPQLTIMAFARRTAERIASTFEGG